MPRSSRTRWPTVADLRRLQGQTVPQDDAFMLVLEGGTSVPFRIARVFLVAVDRRMPRGRHAHRRCRQLLFCISGRCRVTCDDGRNRRSFVLQARRPGLLIPAGIWAEQDYLTDDAAMLVLCDRAYEEADYVRDYDRFLAFRGKRP